MTSIERGLRARHIKPYKLSSFNLDKHIPFQPTILETHNRSGSIDIEFYEDENFPKTLILKVKTIPVPIEKRSVSVQIIVENHIFKSLPYYDLERLHIDEKDLGKSSHYQAINLFYQNCGIWDKDLFKGVEYHNFKINLFENNIIYQKKFKTQTRLQIIQHHLKTDENYPYVISSEGDRQNEKATPILSYGGFYEPCLPIDQIEPTFAIVGYHGQDTTLRLFKYSDLKLEGLNPPDFKRKNDSKWYFPENLNISDCLPLGDSIRGGSIGVSVQHCQTNKIIQYKSINYINENLEKNEIDVVFTPYINIERNE